jgi:hypothetical protein
MRFALITVTEKSLRLRMKLVRDDYDYMEKWSARLIKFPKENGIKY